MPIVKSFKEFDPLAGARVEHFIDTDTNEFLTKTAVEMETCERLALERRQAEGKGQKFKRLIRDGTWKHIGYAPLTIYRSHPEFKSDPKALQRWLELNPKLKSTNAKLT